MIDPGIRAYETELVFNDDGPEPGSNDLAAFLQDELHQPRVLFCFPGKRDGSPGGSHACEIDGTSLCLGNNLLRNDKNVILCQNDCILL